MFKFFKGQHRDPNPWWVKALASAAILGILFLILSAYGVFNPESNYLSFDARYSPWYMKALGTIVYLIAGYFAYCLIRGLIEPTRWVGAAFIALIGLGIGFSVNFTFSKGDIQQHETVFYANGKVNYSKLDRWVERSKEFYDAKGIDTASFMPYVRQYGEFPGYNKYSSIMRDGIRNGTIKPSTAPRANEDFPLPFDK
jgi:hypothetical protein